VELANKLYAACHLEELPETFRKNLSLYVAAYLEDIISGLGLWQGFTTAHTRLYGRCLPFYPTENPYYNQEEASQNAFRMLTEEMLCPPDLLHYCIEKNLLPDAELPEVGEKMLVKLNADFIARHSLLYYYRGD
jgi:hypothetical protein